MITLLITSERFPISNMTGEEGVFSVQRRVQSFRRRKRQNYYAGKFREILGDMFVVTKGLDGCLFVYPNDEWENIENKFREITAYNKRCEKVLPFFLCGSC